MLMTVAFISSETRGGLDGHPVPELGSSPTETKILIDLAQPERDTAIHGAIRELKIIPATIDSRLDLGWAPDDAVIEEYRRTGL